MSFLYSFLYRWWFFGRYGWQYVWGRLPECPWYKTTITQHNPRIRISAFDWTILCLYRWRPKEKAVRQHSSEISWKCRLKRQMLNQECTCAEDFEVHTPPFFFCRNKGGPHLFLAGIEFLKLLKSVCALQPHENTWIRALLSQRAPVSDWYVLFQV